MAVSAEQLLRAVRALVQPLGPAPGQQGAAAAAPDPVPGLCAEQRADHGSDEHLRQGEMDRAVCAGRTEQTRCEQQGVAGKEEADKQPCLGEQHGRDAEDAERGEQ